MLMLLVALAACGTARQRPAAHATASQAFAELPHIPDFAARPYEPFSRAAAVAIALREWRVFGQPVDDDPPDTRPPPQPQDKPERQEALWQRVGEYWYLGQDADRPEAEWTGMHNQHGDEFPADEDSSYAWSAAFISYVMRTAGAANRFPYSPAHHTYIDLARTNAGVWAVTALPPETYAPALGDLICLARAKRPLRYADLPAGDFAAHCDIVVGVAAGMLSVLGGNVDDAVTMKHVPTTAAGTLAEPDGTVVDSRYPWLTVLRVAYAR